MSKGYTKTGNGKFVIAAGWAGAPIENSSIYERPFDSEDDCKRALDLMRYAYSAGQNDKAREIRQTLNIN